MQKKAIKICVNGKKEVLLQADLYVDIKFDKQIIMNYNRILRKVHYYMPRRGSADFPLPAALPSGSIKRSFFEIQSHPDTSNHA